MEAHPKPEDVKKIEQDTYEVLAATGLPYKKVSRYEWKNEEGTAIWNGESEVAGFIEVYLGCDPEAVAHEIGHGFHEALNHNKRAVLPNPFRYPEDGEAVAETIRYFVEQRRGSSWRPTRDLQTLKHCRYNFDEFKAEVRELVR
jgi:hypothetical protein